MKTKEELIKQCRLYKGEDKCPSGVNRWFWQVEQIFVINSLNGYKFDDVLFMYRNSKICSELAGDGVPEVIKAESLVRYLHGTDKGPDDVVSSFVEFYRSEYFLSK